MVRCNKEITKAEGEAAAELPVDFQAALFGVRQFAVVLHAAFADSAGAVQQAGTRHFDVSAVDSVVAAGLDDARCDIRGALGRGEAKQLITLGGLQLIRSDASQVLPQNSCGLAGAGDGGRGAVSTEIACHHFLCVGNEEERHVIPVEKQTETGANNRLAVRGIGDPQPWLRAAKIVVDVLRETGLEIPTDTVVQIQLGSDTPTVLSKKPPVSMINPVGVVPKQRRRKGIGPRRRVECVSAGNGYQRGAGTRRTGRGSGWKRRAGIREYYAVIPRRQTAFLRGCVDVGRERSRACKLAVIVRRKNGKAADGAGSGRRDDRAHRSKARKCIGILNVVAVETEFNYMRSLTPGK